MQSKDFQMEKKKITFQIKQAKDFQMLGKFGFPKDVPKMS